MKVHSANQSMQQLRIRMELRNTSCKAWYMMKKERNMCITKTKDRIIYIYILEIYIYILLIIWNLHVQFT